LSLQSHPWPTRRRADVAQNRFRGYQSPADFDLDANTAGQRTWDSTTLRRNVGNRPIGRTGRPLRRSSCFACRVRQRPDPPHGRRASRGGARRQRPGAPRRTNFELFSCSHWLTERRPGTEEANPVSARVLEAVCTGWSEQEL
jgi:hypothetical protein